MQLNPNGILNGIDGLIVGDELGFNGHTVFHSGNTTIPVVPDISTYDKRYVIKSGDIMTGDLLFSAGKGIASSTGVMEVGRYSGTIYL